MRKKVLFVATVYRFLGFERSDMKILRDLGYEVHTASNMHEADWLKDDGLLDDLDVVKHQVDFARSPFSYDSVRAYRQLKKLSRENHYDLIHCHTPVASAICRMAVKGERKMGTKVLYTDHGFHFHKTSGWKTWMLFYPVEYMMARYTDMILTINKEDYGVIRSFPCKDYRYIPGVGVDVDRIMRMQVDKSQIRKKYGIPENAFVVLSVGELSIRKNQSVIIRALSKIPARDIYYVICGTGVEEDNLKHLAEDNGVFERVMFLGQQPHETVLQLNHASDIGALPSRIEGLGLAGIESLAAGKPVVASGVHGIKDYVIDGETGICCSPTDVNAFKEAILKLYSDKDFYCHCSKNSINKAKEFDIRRVRRLMIENYQNVLGDE